MNAFELMCMHAILIAAFFAVVAITGILAFWLRNHASPSVVGVVSSKEPINQRPVRPHPSSSHSRAVPDLPGRTQVRPLLCRSEARPIT